MLAASLTVSLVLAGCANGGTAATEKPADESIVTSSQYIESENLKSILEANGELDSSESDNGAQDKGKVNKEDSSDTSRQDESLTDQKTSDEAAQKKAAEEAKKKAAEEAKQKKDAAKQSEAQTAEEEILSHVAGIKHFTTVEGKHPNVMAGVAGDDTIAEVTSNEEEINWDKPGKYQLTYTVTTKDGRTAEKTIEIEVYLDLEHYLYGMEGAVYIPVDGTFDPMEHVVTEPEIEKIEPDTSALDTSKEGEYLISYKLTAPGGRYQTAVRKVTVGEEPQTTTGYGTGTGQGAGTTYIESPEGYSTVTDLGLWRLTAYMDTPADQGPYVGQTASGAPLVAGRTVAVSSATCARLGLEFGDRLMVDGHVYVLEDHGGSAMYDSDWLDIYVDNEADEYSDAFNRYAEVYLLR